MSVSQWLKKDNLLFGFLAGLLIPVPATLIFAGLLRLVQNYLHFMVEVKDINILLLGVAVNVVIMRFSFLKFDALNTGKGMLISTVLWVLVFFLLLKRISFTFPF